MENNTITEVYGWRRWFIMGIYVDLIFNEDI